MLLLDSFYLLDHTQYLSFFSLKAQTIKIKNILCFIELCIRVSWSISFIYGFRPKLTLRLTESAGGQQLLST